MLLRLGNGMRTPFILKETAALLLERVLAQSLR